jgi:hypothetical protein
VHDAGFHAVFGLQPVLHHLELQLAHGAQQQHLPATGRNTWMAPSSPSWVRPARSCLLRSGSATSTLRMISGAKKGRPVNCSASPFGQGVAQLQHAVVGNANDVAGKGLVQQLAPLAQEAHHGVGAQLLAAAHHLQAHAALEVAAGHAHEGNAVAVRRVHVGLDLEHHAAELGFSGCTTRWMAGLVAGRRGQVHQRVQHLAHAKVVDRRAEQHRRLAAARNSALSNAGEAPFHQLQFVFGLRVHSAPKRFAFGVVQSGQHFLVATAAVFAGGEHAHLVGAAVVHAAKGLAHAHRPGERHHRHAQLALDLVHQVQRGLHLAVHLVHEGQDGGVARPADLQQAPGLGFHAVAASITISAASTAVSTR